MQPPQAAALPLATPRDCLCQEQPQGDCLFQEQPQGDCLCQEQPRGNCLLQEQLQVQVVFQAPESRPSAPLDCLIPSAMMYTRAKNFEPQGHSSAVASVLYSRGGDKHEVTKSGSYIYHGEASQYHE